MCVPCSAVNVGRKGQPLTLDSQVRTHACMREGGGDGSRQTGTMLSWYPVLGIVQSVLHLNPWQKYSFKIHLNFSGKQLFWYPNCIDVCIFLCLECVIILFKAIFSKHLHTKTNSTHQLVCIKCSTVNVRVTSMWTE